MRSDRGLSSRFLAGPALRFQPDGRLVSLVRNGYESAFEEIFRRYGAALRSYAASIVTAQRADDVTQDAFTKAYLALRGTDKEIQLRPWLYRIVRNTALTDIRDQPEAGVEFEDATAPGVDPGEVAEQREEIKRLLDGLRKLPEPQRAAIVMRELEGLSHEQIAASLGLSGGAVRQQIYRARRALREGVGLLLPMPVLRLLLDEGFAHGASATAAGGGVGLAAKTGIAALLAAGTITTGAVLNGKLKSTPAADATPPAKSSSDSSAGSYGSSSGSRESRNHGSGGDHSGERHSGSASSGAHGGGSGHDGSHSGSGSSGSGSGTSGSGSSGPGPGTTTDTSGSGSPNSGPGSVSSGSGGGDLPDGDDGSGHS